MARFSTPVAPSGDPDERNYQSPKFILGSLTTVTLYHDYICPWCWVGFFHARRLTEEYGLTFDWRGAELIPPSMEYTPAPPKPAEPVDPNAPPKPPSRFDRFLQTEQIELPSPRPTFVRSHAALLGAEFAREIGGPAAFDVYNEGVYRAYWERRADIADIDGVLAPLAASAGVDASAFAESVRAERFAENIVPFDDPVYSIGVRHVPTFLFSGEELLAEANYADLAHAAERFLYRVERLRGKK